VSAHNTLPLREFAADLGALRDRLADAGDEHGATLLEEPIERLRNLADVLDEVLARLGNPPTDKF
jgi:hypothetical protein